MRFQSVRVLEMELSDSQKEIFGITHEFSPASKRIQAFHFSLQRKTITQRRGCLASHRPRGSSVAVMNFPSNTFSPYYSYPIHPGAMHGGGMDLGIGGLQSTLLGALSNSPEAFLGPFPCVKVSNLPLNVSMEDILILFQGFVVIDVLIYRVNEAFVVFANPMDFQMAMQR